MKKKKKTPLKKKKKEDIRKYLCKEIRGQRRKGELSELKLVQGLLDFRHAILLGTVLLLYRTSAVLLRREK